MGVAGRRGGRKNKEARAEGQGWDRQEDSMRVAVAVTIYPAPALP